MGVIQGLLLNFIEGDLLNRQDSFGVKGLPKGLFSDFLEAESCPDQNKALFLYTPEN
jgi:hypothetical protein